MNDNVSIEIRLPSMDNVILRLEDGTIAKEILHVWTQRARKFLDQRFKRNSEGGGDWKPLSPETIRRKMKKAEGNLKRNRRKNRAEEFSALDSNFNRVAILVDTGKLRAALNPKLNNPGYVERQTITGTEAVVSLGFGGSAKHGDTSMTIAELAIIHHFGTQKVPARPIIVAPDEATWNSMVEKADKIIDQITK